MEKRRLRAMVLAVLTGLWLLPASLAHAASTRVTRCDLLLRTKPTTESDALVTIPGGMEIPVEGTSGGWTKTTFKGHSGYVSSNYLMEVTNSGYYPLREGDNNPYVTALQEQLILLGYMTGSASGKYDAATTEAVRSFQKQNGISQDGIAGGQTQSVLFGDVALGNNNLTSSTGATSSAEGTGAATATPSATATPLPSVSGTTLRKGSSGEHVKTLQLRLIELGYLSGSADGSFGSATEKAVIAFQKNSNLSADGKAGTVTQTLLYSNNAVNANGVVATPEPTATPAPTTYATLKRGMTSDAVKNLQVRLKELGYFTSNATGFFGSATLAAVKAFQQANNLQADGIAGSATQTLLFASDTQSNSSTETTETGTTYATLKQGMKSASVTTMQKKLKDLGYFNANATGFYGSITKEAVIAFQKKNGLTADGVAGSATLSLLYSGVATGSGGSSSGSTSGAGKISGPASSSVKLLHWFDSVKPSLKSGSSLLVFDPSTNYAWTLRVLSCGRHCDAEPMTADDTAYMNSALGSKADWTPRVVYVKLPNGTWTMATTHNVPHLSGSVTNNNFDGHLCVHFLRDMSEATQNDPKYGVQNQKVLREAWKNLTGQTIN